MGLPFFPNAADTATHDRASVGYEASRWTASQSVGDNLISVCIGSPRSKEAMKALSSAGTGVVSGVLNLASVGSPFHSAVPGV